MTGESNFTWGSPVRAHAGGYDAFVAKLNTNGDLIWNTFLGNDRADYAIGLTVDGSGNAYVTGISSAPWGSPVQAHSGFNDNDAFVARLDASGNLIWNTFLGCAGYLGDDKVNAITLDSSGNVYAVGSNNAAWGSPVRAHAGGYDAFVTKLNSSGSFVWNTFLGGSLDDSGSDITFDSSGNVYVSGSVTPGLGFPCVGTRRRL